MKLDNVISFGPTRIWIGPVIETPHPGWTPPAVGVPGECMRLAFSCVTGISPRTLPFVDPFRRDFWPRWFDLAERVGRRMIQAPEHFLPAPEQLWIAGVSGDGKSGKADHAIVMRGEKLHYDPNWVKPRKRRPTKIYSAYLVANPAET